MFPRSFDSKPGMCEHLAACVKLGVVKPDETNVKGLNAKRCRNCNNISVIEEIVQTRSADEESTRITHCLRCKTRY